MLTINIEQNSSSLRESIWEQKTAPRLEELVRRSARVEELTMNNKYDCRTCGKLQNATRQMSVAFAPKMLVLQLKRFSHVLRGRNMYPVKLEDFIQFEKGLVLDCNIGNLSLQTHYVLKGLIVHKGRNLSNGHYIAYVKEGTNWMEWSDEFGTSVSWEKVKTQQAYILFFETIEEPDVSQSIVKEVKTDEVSDPVQKLGVLQIIGEDLKADNISAVNAAVPGHSLHISSDDFYDPAEEKTRSRKRKQRKAKMKWLRKVFSLYENR